MNRETFATATSRDRSAAARRWVRAIGAMLLAAGLAAIGQVAPAAESAPPAGAVRGAGPSQVADRAADVAELAGLPSPEPGRIDLPSLSERRLDNGLTVYVMERPQVPVVEMTLSVPAGSLLDPVDAPGLAGLTATLTRGGTVSHSADELSAAFDQLGASVGAGAGLESAEISTIALSDHLEEVLPFVAEMAMAPTFPESEFSLRWSEMLAGVKQWADLPSVLADMHAQAFYYGADHPLGRVPSEASVQRMSVQDVRDFYEEHWRPEGSSLFIIGDVETATAMRLAETYFGAWKKGTEAADVAPTAGASDFVGALSATSSGSGGGPLPEPVALDAGRIRFVEKTGMTQVQIRLTQPGVTFEDERRLSAQVANYVLGGGGFASRLMKEIRSNSGWTYGISSRLDSRSFDGTWSITTFTRSEELFDTLGGVERVLETFVRGGVTDEELRAAKGQLIGSYPMAYETLSGLAAQVREATRRGYDMEYLASRAFDYEKVSLGEVNDAIEELLDPSAWSIVLVGDPKVLEDAPETVFGVPTDEIERVSWTDPVRGYEGDESF